MAEMKMEGFWVGEGVKDPRGSSQVSQRVKAEKTEADKRALIRMHPNTFFFLDS